MSCNRGKANPDSHTKLRLFAASAGYCQNPECNVNLFLTIGSTEIHIAEMAHIISAGDDGPRSNKVISKELKGDFDNLILLCPNCHTKVDKAEKEFSEELIYDWKKSHSQRINSIFQIKEYKDRYEVRQEVLPILIENSTIFENYGPMTEERYNPESRMPVVWLSKIQQCILPNNRRLLSIIENNYKFLKHEEIKTVQLFRQHVLDFESRHINNVEIDGIQFPKSISQIFEN